MFTLWLLFEETLLQACINIVIGQSAAQTWSIASGLLSKASESMVLTIMQFVMVQGFTWRGNPVY